MSSESHEFPITISDKNATACNARPDLMATALALGQANNQMRAAMHIAKSVGHGIDGLPAVVNDMVLSQVYLLSILALHVFLQQFDMAQRVSPRETKTVFNEPLAVTYLATSQLDDLRDLYDTHRFNSGPVGFARNKMVAHIDPSRVRRFVDQLAHDHKDVELFVSGDDKHWASVSTGAQRMAMVISSAAAGDLAAQSESEFAASVATVVDALTRGVRLGDEFEMSVFRNLAVSVVDSKGAEYTWK